MTDQTVAAPALGDLLAKAPSNWGKWGADDEVGSLNYLGPEQAIAAAALVRSGKVFTLQRLIGDPKGDPVWPGRKPAVRTQIMDEATWDGADAPPGALISRGSAYPNSTKKFFAGLGRRRTRDGQG